MNENNARLPLAELTSRAIRLLCREFGAADTARFIGQYSNGSGDDTAERDALFAGRTLPDLLAGIRAAAKPPG